MMWPRSGVLVALALPCDNGGQLLESAVSAHLAWLRAQGVDGVLALGSSSGFPLFSLEQRKRILAKVIELADPLPVMANISDVSPARTCELGKSARELGARAVAVMPPHFFPCSGNDQLEFFERAAEAAGLPVVLYNFPELTGNRIALDTIGAATGRFPVAGIKQSGAEFSYHEALIALGREKGFAVFCGADPRFPDALALGAAGCIGGLVNSIADLMVSIYRIARRQQAGDMSALASQLSEIGAIIRPLTIPTEVAACMEARGFETGVPGHVLSAETLREKAVVVDTLRQRFEQWGLEPYERLPVGLV